MTDLDKIRDTLGRAQKYIRLAVGATKTDTGRLVFADEQIDLVFDLLRSLPLIEPGGESHTEELRTAVRKLGHGLIAVSPLLDKPYSDAPEWTPWRRFVAPRLAEVRRLVGLERPTPISSEEPT